MNTELIAKHYLIACIWADCPEGTNPRATKQAIEAAKHTAAEFVKLAGPLLDELREYPEYWAHPDCGGHLEAAIGHDLYLTSAGHGVGFWDRDLGELGDKLSAICGWNKPISEPCPQFYRGWLYL